MKRKAPLIFVCILLVFALGYLTFAYAPFTARLRQIYVETAMGTLRHQWLATALLPSSVVEEAMSHQIEEQSAQTGVRTQWPDAPQVTAGEITDEESFFSLYHEISPQSLHLWLAEHPQALTNGWENLRIMPEDNAPIVTIHGETVLAIDAPNKILLIQVEAANSTGVLAVAKDPRGLSICPSAGIGTTGETVGQIADANGGILAMTGSAFHDANDGGTGGDLAGYAMCSGTEYGTEHLPAGNKRVELRTDHRLYITDSTDPVSEACTNAVEFRPALIIDGQLTVEQGWAGLQPRVCLGQSDRYEILMLVMEGRLPAKGILGASVLECARILKQHGCKQAINLDGGNSAMLWYDGRYLIRSCDPDHENGRPVPTAVVWGSKNPS